MRTDFLSLNIKVIPFIQIPIILSLNLKPLMYSVSVFIYISVNNGFNLCLNNNENWIVIVVIDEFGLFINWVLMRRLVGMSWPPCYFLVHFLHLPLLLLSSCLRSFVICFFIFIFIFSLFLFFCSTVGDFFWALAFLLVIACFSQVLILVYCHFGQH